MGHEPYLKVLQDHPDVRDSYFITSHNPDVVQQIDIIIGGRSYDPAPYAAFSYLHGIDPGVAYHMGKIMECGGLCATPKGSVSSLPSPLRRLSETDATIFFPRSSWPPSASTISIWSR